MITEVDPVATVVLDGSGNGQVSLGPPQGTKWAPRLATLATSTSTKTPQGFLYRGSPSGPLQLIDQTFLGNAASSQKVAGAIYFPGQLLWAKWVGGDPGALATLQVFGQQGLRNDPFESALVGEGFAPNNRSITLPTGAGAGTARIVIGPDLPAPLGGASPYDFTAAMPLGAGPFNAVAAILFYIGTAGDSYQFMAMVRNSPTTVAAIFTGSVSGSSMVEVVAGVPEGFMTQFGTGILTFGPQLITSNSSLQLKPGAPFFIDNVSQGRGLVANGTGTAAVNVASPGPGTLFGASSFSYVKGRAYKASFRRHDSCSTVPSTAVLNLVTGGGVTVATVQIELENTSQVEKETTFFFRNDSAGTFVTAMALTISPSAGTYHLTADNANQPYSLIIEDCGASGDYTAFPTF